MAPDSTALTTARRQATEDKILDALETVLVRDGIRQLSLNAIVDEAEVGKPLLYRYFDNLPGLLTAWVERRGPQPSGRNAGKEAVDSSELDKTEFFATLADQLLESAAQLRQQPILLEMLAEELTAKSELTEPFARARRRRSKQFVSQMLKDSRYSEPEVRGKIIVLYAAIHYLAMRARRSPNFMGLRLDTRKGWQEAMSMVRNLVVSS